MQTEESCKPSEKFLQAAILFSDKLIKLWQDQTVKRCKNREKDNASYYKFINWTRQENEVAVFTLYAYADLSIPKQFDYIFNYANPEIYIHEPFVLTQSILEAWYPINCIGHGHKHLCIFTFDNQIPDIFKQLHYETEKETSWTWNANKVLGICNFQDVPAIIDRQQNITKLKAVHGDNWYDFDEQN
jgi:hypothetical protein